MARFNRYIRKITSDFWRDRFKPADLLRVFSHIQSILSARLDEYLLGEYDLLDIDIHTVGHTRVWVPTEFIFSHKISNTNEYYPYVYQIERYWIDVDAVYDHHIDPELCYQNNIDFVYDGNGVIRFSKELPNQLETPLYISKGHWAGYRIQKAIGDLLGYNRIDSVFYRDSIAVILNPFFNGPTYDALLALWNIILGIPVVKYGQETVISVSGSVVKTDKYTYDLGNAIPIVSKGDKLDRFQVLTNVVELITHKTNPYWWEERAPEIFQKYLVNGVPGDYSETAGEITKEARDYIMETFLFDVVLSIKIHGQYIDITKFTNNLDLVYLFYEALPTRTDPILSQSYGLNSRDPILDNGFIFDTPESEGDDTPGSGTEDDSYQDEDEGEYIHRGDGNGTGTGKLEDVEDPDDEEQQHIVITGILTPKVDVFKTRIHINSIYGTYVYYDENGNKSLGDMYVYSPSIGRPYIPKDTDDEQVDDDGLSLSLDDYHWHILDRDQDFIDDFNIDTYSVPDEYEYDDSYKHIPSSNFYEFWREESKQYSFVEPTYSKVFGIFTVRPDIKKQRFDVVGSKFTGEVDADGFAIVEPTGEVVDTIDNSQLASYIESDGSYVDSFGNNYVYTGDLNTYNTGYSYFTSGARVPMEDTGLSDEFPEDTDLPLVSDLADDPSMSIDEQVMNVTNTSLNIIVKPQDSSTAVGFHDQGIMTHLIQSHYKFGIGAMLWWEDKSEDAITYTMDGITLVGSNEGYIVSKEIYLGVKNKHIIWDMSLRLQGKSDIIIEYCTDYYCTDDDGVVITDEDDSPIKNSEATWTEVSKDTIQVIESESTILTDSHNLYWNGDIRNVSGSIWFKFRLIPDSTTNDYNVPILSSVGITVKLR